MRSPNSHDEVPTTPTIPTKFHKVPTTQVPKTLKLRASLFQQIPTDSNEIPTEFPHIPTSSNGNELLNSNKLQNLFKVKLQQVSGICNISGKIMLPSVGKCNVGVLLELTTTFRQVLNDLNTLELVLTLRQLRHSHNFYLGRPRIFPNHPTLRQ